MKGFVLMGGKQEVTNCFPLCKNDRKMKVYPYTLLLFRVSNNYDFNEKKEPKHMYRCYC